MMFIAGVNLKYIVILGVIGVAGVIVLMTQVGWRAGRISAMFDPWAYKLNEGWQIIQSLMALGSGGVFGQGLGNGKQKLLFMPEAENDYIFAHIGEELGLIGTLLVLFAFMYLLLRGTRVAINVKDRFASLMASGFMIMIGLQVMINIAVVTNSIPSTGMPLPFLSYGGTSLLANLIAMGILLNISKYADTT
jgi:cell division protein FtsW